MKKFALALTALASLLPGFAEAQQYVSPAYMQNGGYVQPAPGYGVPPSYGYGSQQNAGIPLSAAPGAPMPVTPSNAVMPATNGAYTSNTYYNTTVAVPAYGSFPQGGYDPNYRAPAVSAQGTYVGETHAGYGYNWSGCYLGGYGGGAFPSDSVKAGPLRSTGGFYPAGTPYNVTTSSYRYDLSSNFNGGGTLGCNTQIGRPMGLLSGVVLGMEGEGGFMSLTGSGRDVNSNYVAGDTVDKTKLSDWDGIAAGRVGLAFDRLLVYGKAGAVFANVKSSVTDTCTTGSCGLGTINATSGDHLLIDPAFGGGLEYALSPSWSVKGEYMYLDTTDKYSSCGAGGGAASGSNFCSEHELSGIHTVKVGLNYHFN